MIVIQHGRVEEFVDEYLAYKKLYDRTPAVRLVATDDRHVTSREYGLRRVYAGVHARYYQAERDELHSLYVLAGVAEELDKEQVAKVLQFASLVESNLAAYLRLFFDEVRPSTTIELPYEVKPMPATWAPYRELKKEFDTYGPEGKPRLEVAEEPYADLDREDLIRLLDANKEMADALQLKLKAQVDETEIRRRAYSFLAAMLDRTTIAWVIADLWVWAQEELEGELYGQVAEIIDELEGEGDLQGTVEFAEALLNVVPQLSNLQAALNTYRLMRAEGKEC